MAQSGGRACGQGNHLTAGLSNNFEVSPRKRWNRKLRHENLTRHLYLAAESKKCATPFRLCTAKQSHSALSATRNVRAAHEFRVGRHQRCGQFRTLELRQRRGDGFDGRQAVGPR